MKDKNVIQFTKADLGKSHRFLNTSNKSLVVLPPDGHVFSWDEESGCLICEKTKKKP